MCAAWRKVCMLRGVSVCVCVCCVEKSMQAAWSECVCVCCVEKSMQAAWSECVCVCVCAAWRKVCKLRGVSVCVCAAWRKVCKLHGEKYTRSVEKSMNAARRKVCMQCHNGGYSAYSKIEFTLFHLLCS